MKKIAIIPARAGSKGVKNKNIRLVGGVPLICHSIVTAIESNIYTDVIVTTDSSEIADIAINAGAKVPFIRSAKLSDGKALAVDVMLDVLDKLRIVYCDNSYFVMLQPTSPIRTIDDYMYVDQMMRKKSVQSLISVTECSEHPYKMVRKGPESLRMQFLDWPVENPPRQSLPPVYVYNGAFYAAKINEFLINKSFVTKSTKLYDMPRERSVNIDDELDLILADALLNR